MNGPGAADNIASPAQGRWERLITSKPILLGAALALATLALYWQAVSFEAFTFDDNHYVLNSGLLENAGTLKGVEIALKRVGKEYYFPLTMLSFLLDASIFGNDPEAFHRTNVLLFSLNALLLFIFLNRATGSVWRSLFAAALFAFHPLRAESVAWIAARKDLLSGVFFFLCLHAYTVYRQSGSRRWYAWMLATLTAGLFSKAVLMIVPLVLILLDHWPLRAQKEGGEGLIPSPKALADKAIPALLAIFTISLNLYLLRPTTHTLARTSALQRILDIPVIYAGYLSDTIWPTKLTYGMDYYPPASWPASLLAFLLLGAVTFLALRLRKEHPYLAVGWLWWLLALLPTSGIARTGNQFVAGRFTYLPHVGLMIIAAWGLPELLKLLRLKRGAVVGVAFILLAASGAATSHHLPHWRNGEAMGRYMIEVDPEEGFSYYFLGMTYYFAQRYDEATVMMDLSLARPNTRKDAMLKRAVLHAKAGEFGKAKEKLGAIIKDSPLYPDAHFLLGHVYATTGDASNALREYLAELNRNPKHMDALYNLGVLTQRTGKFEMAEKSYRSLLALWPEDPLSSFNLGLILLNRNDYDGAAGMFAASLSSPIADDAIRRKADLCLRAIPILRSGQRPPFPPPEPEPFAMRRFEDI